MNPEDIDDLFRQRLAGHHTPPADDLWQRLQLPAAEAPDELFRQQLGAHATPPRRELWERLEDEHLRPQPRRKRRVAAWWQYSAAAVLLLLLLAGGARLWQAGYLRPADSRAVATAARRVSSAPQLASAPATAPGDQARPLRHPAPPALATQAAAVAEAQPKKQNFSPTQATARAAATSSTPIATTTPARRPATARRVVSGYRAPGQQPDAATGQLASTGRRNAPASQHPTTPLVAANQAVAPATSATTPVVAAASAQAAAPEIIEVEVRRGPEPARPAAPAVVAVAEAAPAPARRGRLRLGGLLRQADHLVHGEAVSLAEATSPGETVTVQARLGGRLISRTIEL